MPIYIRASCTHDPADERGKEVIPNNMRYIHNFIISSPSPSPSSSSTASSFLRCNTFHSIFEVRASYYQKLKWLLASNRLKAQTNIRISMICCVRLCMLSHTIERRENQEIGSQRVIFYFFFISLNLFLQRRKKTQIASATTTRFVRRISEWTQHTWIGFKILVCLVGYRMQSVWRVATINSWMSR